MNDARIYIRGAFDDDGHGHVIVACGSTRIDMTFDDISRRIPIDEIDRQLMTMVIAQLRLRGVSVGRIKSVAGRLAVIALTKHVRFSLESSARIRDFGGLPLTDQFPLEQSALGGMSAMMLTA